MGRRAPRQWRDRARDMPLGMRIPRGACWDSIRATPRRGPGRLAPPRGCIDHQPRPLLRPILEPGGDLGPQGGWGFRLGGQGPGTHPPSATAQARPPWARPLPTGGEAATRRDTMRDQLRGPQAQGIAYGTWAAPHRLLKLPAWLRREASGAAWHRGTHQPGPPRRVTGVPPTPAGCCIAGPPRRHRGTALAVSPQQHPGLALAQTASMRPATGVPHRSAGDCGVGERQQRQCLPGYILYAVRSPGLENRDAFLGLL